jgi:hypothetical protein
MKVYKIVHREFGSLAHYPDTEKEARDLIELLTRNNINEKKQYYIKDISYGHQKQKNNTLYCV